MTVRSLEARLAKLETRGGRTDKFLVVWRLPDGDVAAAASDAKYARGDRVVCFEWFGSEPVPAPRWHKNLRGDFTDEEQVYVTRTLERYVEAECFNLRIRPPPDVNPDSLKLMTECDLYHSVFGVET